jgi:hypothetical protein
VECENFVDERSLRKINKGSVEGDKENNFLT